ncbi:Protein kinase-like domain protein [Cordyceps fumosorosea ARSEF 2679]|uniref:Protein kinase-like domain protein n=1 Tax=Cordyceps fumosorosea (strain ARSEF 2679) TaxID=1081104 RepID=A0A167LYQ2_CORFA|nr:Protein kinase-like domain protein [Cordyceps fumosorosea ARSEF 2679]OAA53696.1 Protein kinase-like domain protein [Cordyceps fumosorosea ARSEF 2679]
MADTPNYQIRSLVWGDDEDGHNATFKVRRNGTVFSIEIRPSYFINSPDNVQKFLELIQPDENFHGNIDTTKLFDWVMSPFMQLLTDLAPPADDPNETEISHQDRLSPEWYLFHSYFINEKPEPRHIFTCNDRVPGGRAFANKMWLDELEQWTVLYEPADIILSPENLQESIHRRPRRVLIKDGAIVCFYKACHSIVGALGELSNYRAIADSGLYQQGLNTCRVHGVVIDSKYFLAGILLSYIDGTDLPHALGAIHEEPDYPSHQLRRVWMQQLDDGLAALHKAGIVWGDATAENVLIDKDNNAWIINFGGRYTEGWVDEELFGTVEGDLMGLFKIWKLLFPPEAHHENSMADIAEPSH